MQLSSIPSPMTAITGASAAYHSAIEKLTSPNELPFAVIADGAKTDVGTAVELLTPLTKGGDMFSSRNATSSIASAKEAIGMIDGLNNPAADTPVTIDDVVAKIQYADSALWWESVGG